MALQLGHARTEAQWPGGRLAWRLRRGWQRRLLQQLQQALQRLGVPSPELLGEMAERIQSLEARLAELENRSGAAPGPEATPRGKARTTGK